MKENGKKEGEAASEAGESPSPNKLDSGSKPGIRALSMLDLILRSLAAIGVLGSALAMGKTSQTLPFSTNSTQFRADYDDIPTLTFFLIANSIVCAYVVVISIPLSILNIIKNASKNSRILLVILDTVMLSLLTSSAAAAAAIAYLAHKGNSQANWLPFCQQYNSFCSRISGALVGSFGAVLVLMTLIITLSITISRC